MALVICCNLGTLVSARDVFASWNIAPKTALISRLVVKHLGKKDGLKTRDRWNYLLIALYLRNAKLLISSLCFYRVSSCKLRESRLASWIHRLPLEDDGFSSGRQLSRTVKKKKNSLVNEWLNYWWNSVYILYIIIILVWSCPFERTRKILVNIFYIWFLIWIMQISIKQRKYLILL